MFFGGYILVGGGKAYSASQDIEPNDLLLEAGLDVTGQQKPKVLVVTSARWRSVDEYQKVSQRIINYYTNKGLAANLLHPYLSSTHCAGELIIDFSNLLNRQKYRIKSLPLA